MRYRNVLVGGCFLDGLHIVDYPSKASSTLLQGFMGAAFTARRLKPAPCLLLDPEFSIRNRVPSFPRRG